GAGRTGRGWPQRPVRTGPHGLRDAYRQAAVHRRNAGGTPGESAVVCAAARARVCARHATEPGGRHRKVPGAEGGAPVEERDGAAPGPHGGERRLAFVGAEPRLGESATLSAAATEGLLRARRARLTRV